MYCTPTLVPVVLRSTQLDAGITTISTSPVIFVGSVLFALLTVLLSCSKPGKMAARVSPVEATKMCIRDRQFILP